MKEKWNRFKELLIENPHQIFDIIISATFLSLMQTLGLFLGAFIMTLAGDFVTSPLIIFLLVEIGNIIIVKWFY